MTTAVDTLRAGYEAFGRGDIPTVLAIFDDTIEWYSPDELPGGGTFHGPSEVMGFFADLPNHFQELRVEPDRYLDAGNEVIVEGHTGGRVNDTPFDVGFAHVWTVKDGRAVRFREYMDTGKLLPLFTAAS